MRGGLKKGMATDSEKYYEDFILRKEGRNKWIQYWVVIRGVWMLFYGDKATNSRDNFRGSIELSSRTKCNIARRGNYSFPFYLNTDRGTHLFKCDTNLKRHQWMYLIELASKGAPPIPAPQALPFSTAVVITEEHLISHDTQQSHTETKTPDSEPEEDDFSIPPGVILVTTPIYDLSHNEETANDVNTGSQLDPSAINRAVLATSIGGETIVVQEPSVSKTAPEHGTKRSARKQNFLFQRTGAELSNNRKSSFSAPFPGGLSPHSAHSSNRGNPDRPSTSPSSTLNRKMLTPASASRDNIRFSRHMTRSSPDIQFLSLEDPILKKQNSS